MKKHILTSLILLIVSFAQGQVPNYVPTNGLVGWWPFNGNANDASGNGYNGAVNGATLTTDRYGNNNQSYQFNGSTSLITLDGTSTINFSSGVTFSAWIYSYDYRMASIVDKTPGCPGVGFRINTRYNHDITSEEACYGSGVSVSTAPSAYSVDNWVFVVGTLDLISGTNSVYINGNLISSENTAQPFSNTDIIAIGSANVIPYPVPYEFFYGKIDDVGIWTRALNACEINELYNSQLNTFTVSAGSDQSICFGESVILSTSGPLTYSWDNGVQNGTSFIPTTSQTYTLTGTAAYGCIATDQVVVTVNALPTVNAGADQSVCAGTAVTLSASGANTYAWNNNVSNGLAFTPTASGTYSVIGTDGNGCTNTDQVAVTVNLLPTVNAGADQSICKGAAVTLSGTGATTYAWNNNVTNGVAFNPIATASYSVSGTDANGCTNADEVIVTVNEASASTLTESAMDSYTLNGQTYTQSGTYTQTITNAAGCDSTITLNLTLSFTGLGELSQAVRIFPNPANDILNIESTSPLIGDYTMYDAAGRVILQGTFTGMITSIDVRNIAPGTYTLQAKELLERVVVLRR